MWANFFIIQEPAFQTTGFLSLPAQLSFPCASRQRLASAWLTCILTPYPHNQITGLYVRDSHAAITHNPTLHPPPIPEAGEKMAGFTQALI